MFVAANGGRLPDFLIVGAAKSGTTSLFFYLAQHPQIEMASVKEPRFFVCEVDRKTDAGPDFDIARTIISLNEYTDLYREAGEKLCGDASTDYLYLHDVSIKNIYAQYGDKARSLPIIIMLRNPIDRAWSHYMMQKREGKEPLDFLEASKKETIEERLTRGWPVSFDYLGYGYYANQVKAFKFAFDNVLVLKYDDFERNASETVLAIWRFLGLSDDVEVDVRSKYNVSGQPKGRLHAIVARMLYGRSRLKKFMKRIIPQPVRYWVRTRVSGVLFAKTKIPDDVQSLLSDVYRDDVRRLYENERIDFSR